MKKIYNAPYLKVVEVKNNDILTTSLTDGMPTNDNKGNFFAPRRGTNIWSDGESVEDMDF